jgi:hypothetical protein
MPPLSRDPIWAKVNPAQELSPAATEGKYPRRSINARNETSNELLNHEALRLIDCYPARRKCHASITRINEAKEDNLNVEVISVLCELRTPFAIQQRTTRKLNGEQVMILFVPSSPDGSKANLAVPNGQRHEVG